MEEQQQEVVTEEVWYFEDDGVRKGPVSTSEMNNHIKNKKIGYGCMIWCAS